MKRIILSIVAVVCVNIGLAQERFFTIDNLNYEVKAPNEVKLWGSNFIITSLDIQW